VNRLLFNLKTAIEAVAANKIRAFLTALGIIFGVAAVITMLAIGTGAKQEIVEQMELVGVNNIVINAVWQIGEAEKMDNENGKKKRFSEGLTLQDALDIQHVLPTAKRVSPEIVIDYNFVTNGIQARGKVIGIVPDYFEINNMQVIEGNIFSVDQLNAGMPVCLVTEGVARKFFDRRNAVGENIKCGNNWLKIVGVIKERNVSENALKNLGIRKFDNDVYVPIKTALLRFKNRALVTESAIEKFEEEQEDEEASNSDNVNYHQLDKIVVQVSETDYLSSSAEVINRLLKRKHKNEDDFEITIPELLLKQQQRTKDIFNFVLGAIAAISLLVGGIGIMNIMLASILERIKEIGLRLSIGATKKDIISQFIFESIVISFSGGLIGIALGVIGAILINKFADILTVITASGIIISFGISVLVGLLFGILPARKAALQDPIKSLRHE